MKISDSIRKEQPETGRQKGSALGLAEMNSDGKRTKDVFLVCEKFRENAVLGAVLPLFLFCLQKEKIPKGL